MSNLAEGEDLRRRAEEKGYSIAEARSKANRKGVSLAKYLKLPSDWKANVAAIQKERKADWEVLIEESERIGVDSDDFFNAFDLPKAKSASGEYNYPPVPDTAWDDLYNMAGQEMMSGGRSRSLGYSSLDDARKFARKQGMTLAGFLRKKIPKSVRR